MDHLIEYQRPELRDPIMLVAFAGWNDAAEAATTAVRLLIREWNAELSAAIDPEEFFVFTETRPHVRGADPSHREIVWPSIHFFAVRVPRSPRDVLILLGTEPQLRWKAFTHLVLDYATSMGVRSIVALGALLADVLHSHPPVLTGAILDPELAPRARLLRLRRSHYEGPTGILGVLGARCRALGLASSSIWGNVPHYVSSTTNPVIAAALVRAVGQLLDLPVDVSDLDRAAIRFNRQIAEAIAIDEEVARYVRQLEERAAMASADTQPGDSTEPEPTGTGDLPNPDVIVRQLEEFLRQRGQDDQSE